MSLIAKALEFGANAHEGQVRKYTGNPYFNEHCVAVAARVKARGGDDDMIVAALLHDTVEDTDVTLDEVEREFGIAVASLVDALTDRYTHEAYPELNRAKRKKLEAERMATVSDAAKEIKLCDMMDNTESIVSHDPGFAKVYLREKAYLLECMFPTGVD